MIVRYTLLVAIIGLSALQAHAQTGDGSKTDSSGTRKTARKVIIHRDYDNDDDRDGQNDEKKYAQKTFTRELPMGKQGEVVIETNSRPLEIKTWSGDKVKVEITANVRTDNNLSDDELFDKLGLSLKSYADGVQITASSNGYSSVYYGGDARSKYYSFSQNIGSGSLGAIKGSVPGSVSGSTSTTTTNGAGEINTPSRKPLLVIYVPGDAHLEVDSRNASVTLTGKIDKLKLVSNYAPVEIESVNHLTLRNKYGNVLIASCKDAEIEQDNGRLTVKSATSLDIDSKYSSVELGTVETAVIRSSSDEYDIESVAHIRGRKNYGNLRIGTLTKSMDLDGSNADIRVRNTASSVESVKIENKYADIRLPVKELANYAVEMNGSYNSVYGSFEKIPVKEEATATKDDKDEDLKAKTVTGRATPKPRLATFSNGVDGDNPSHFTAKTGNGSGPKFLINCTSCTVDFK